MLSYDITIKAFIINDENLNNSEKIFYANVKGLITCLGYCWATNAYLSKIAKVSIRQVRRYLEKFKKLGLIIVEITRDKNGRVTGRKIYTRESFSDKQDIERVYGKNPIFKDKFREDINVPTPPDMDVLYIRNNSTYKEKEVRKESVREKQKPPAPPPVPPIPKKIQKKKEMPVEVKNLELTEDERKNLEDSWGKAVLAKYEEKRAKHLKKCHKSCHHKKRAIETIREFYEKELKEKNVRDQAREKNKTQVAVKEEAKNQEYVTKLLKTNSSLEGVISVYKNHIDTSVKSSNFSRTHRDSIRYDDLNFRDRLEEFLQKFSIHENVDLNLIFE